MFENQNHWLISESDQSIWGPSQDIVPDGKRKPRARRFERQGGEKRKGDVQLHNQSRQ